MTPEQVIVCEGRGSKWLINASNHVEILARLIECPICKNEKEPES